MSSYFYFTRHGQTIWNVENKICGATDIALTSLGHDQATGIACREEIRLKEQNFGRYESTARDGEEFAKAKMNFVYDFDGGETMLHLCQRIYNLIDDIKNDSEDKVYLLVAHNGISRIVESYFNNMTNEEFSAFGIKNCELKKYTFR